jgi:hypothetical protein
MANCSAVPLKAPRGKSSKKGKGGTDETSSSSVHPEKTKPLEEQTKAQIV